MAPKGVLLVNTYRELPIAEQTQLTFPNQMLPCSVSTSLFANHRTVLYVIALLPGESKPKSTEIKRLLQLLNRTCLLTSGVNL